VRMGNPERYDAIVMGKTMVASAHVACLARRAAESWVASASAGS
jgi:hypothetical protein